MMLMYLRMGVAHFFSLMFYRVSVTGHSGSLGVIQGHDALTDWQLFAIELTLSFMVVMCVFATFDPNRKSLGSDSLAIGLAYLAATFLGVSVTYTIIHPRPCPLIKSSIHSQVTDLPR